MPFKCNFNAILMTVKHLLQAVRAGLRKLHGADVIREGRKEPAVVGMGHPGVGLEAVPLSLELSDTEGRSSKMALVLWWVCRG